MNNPQTGKISWFGGPDDKGVAPDEGLAILSPRDLVDPSFRDLFLPQQPPGTTGLARRLNPAKYYCAMRWDYAVTPLSMLRGGLVRITFGANEVCARPADWGPNANTDRIIDASPGVLAALGATTDDVVTVEFIPGATA